MKRTRWVFVAAAVAGAVVLVAPAVGQGRSSGSAGSLLRAGSLDPSFGLGGVVSYRPAGGTYAAISGIAVQPDGKIVVVGSKALARYLPDGSPDPSFGTGGYVEIPAGDFAGAVVWQSDGRIVVGGSYDQGDNYPGYDSSGFWLARYNPDGSLDASFGTDGVVTTDNIPGPGGYVPPSWCKPGCRPSSFVKALAILPGGKIVAGGSTTAEDFFGDVSPTSSAFVLARYTSDGSLDVTFNDGGIVQASFTGFDWFAGMVVLPSGKIVATGKGTGDGHGSFSGSIELAGYLPNGSLDYEEANSRRLDYYGGPPTLQHGKILVAGSPALARYGANGRLDHSFGKNGFVKIRPVSGASAVVTQPDGKILLAVRKSVVRLTPNGQLDKSFGAGGVVHLGHNESSLGLQADGKILVGGGSAGLWTLARLISRPA